MFGGEIQRVTGRKDVYHEVDEFICNDVVLTTKILLTDYPRAFDKDLLSIKIIIQLETVVIDTEDFILKGREQDRLKISMPAIPMNKEETEDFKHGNI
jgi:NADH-quinone oxidoreductase subunit G